MQLILSLAALAHLAVCLDVAGGLKEKGILQSDEEGEGRHPSRHHSNDHHHHHHHGRHRHHRRHHDHHHHEDCPPCDLSICTSKFGNFTVITRPVTWEQAPNSCAMIGLRLARINIENFMDATNAAFKCSGPFSQSWVHSWNGDAYGGKGLVLSTGNAAPGGAINEVVDCNTGRNVVCEVSDGPVKKPDCDHDHRGCHCGCNRPGCQCGTNPTPRPEPVLHSKMKCLRCFCRRNAECPLQGGPSVVPVGPTGVTPIVPVPSSTGRPTSTRGRPTQTPVVKAAEQKKDTGAVEQKQAGAVEKALNAVGRFIQIPKQKEQAQEKSGAFDKKEYDGEDEEDDEHHGEGDDEGEEEEEEYEEEDQEDYEVEQVVFDNDAKSLEKGFPFMPETCGAQCVCYACKDYEPERNHHRRCHHHRSHHHHHRRVLERDEPNDELKKAAVQLQSLRQIVAFDETGKQIDQVDIDADQDLKIQIL